MTAAPEMFSRFGDQNPNRPDSRFECNAQRTVPAGGALAGLLLHDSVTPLDWNLRALPTPGFYTASRQNPFQMTVGALTVPSTMALALCEYRFRLYRFDGLNPGDAVPLEDRRLSLEVGNYTSISNFAQRGNILMQIIPAVPPVENQNLTGTFAGTPTGGTVGMGGRLQGRLSSTVAIENLYGPGGMNNVFSSAAPALAMPGVNTRQFVTSAQGNALIPNSNDPQQGPERLPFTYYVTENQSISLDITVFGTVRTPINFIEGVIAGYLMPMNSLRALLEKLRPCEGT